MTWPKITIVTPSFNDERFLQKAICSVLDQNYPSLEYIVLDGGSTDKSVDIIRKYESHLTYWESKPDGGMYDAINRGFQRSTGEIMGWINSDDKHQPGSLYTIAQIFSDFANIEWVQGTPTVIDEADRIFTDSHRFDVDKYFFYRRRHAATLKFIQQESTFWRRSLWDRAGAYVSREYKYAGDFELWIRFFQHASLYNVNAVLGSFRQTRGGQASVDHLKEYLEETFQILDRYPLLKKEKWHMRSSYLKEESERFLQRMIGKIPFKGSNPTVFKDRLYFSPKEQKLKSW